MNTRSPGSPIDRDLVSEPGPVVRNASISRQGGRSARGYSTTRNPTYASSSVPPSIRSSTARSALGPMTWP
jgi:hypothetical protein